MKKLFRRSHTVPVRSDGAPPQAPAEYAYTQRQQPQHGIQHLTPTGSGSPSISPNFGHLSLTPQPQSQSYAPNQQQQHQQTQYQQQRQSQSPQQQQQFRPQQGYASFQPSYPASSSSPGPHGGPSAGLGGQPPSAQNADIGRFLVEQADILIAKNDFNGAITTYTLAIQNNPMDPDLLVKRAYAYRMAEPPRLDEALRDAQTACRNNPYDWKIWSQLGQISLQNKDARSAQEALEKAIELGGSQVPPVTYSALSAARAAAEQQGPTTASPRIEVSQPTQQSPSSQTIQSISRRTAEQSSLSSQSPQMAHVSLKPISPVSPIQPLRPREPLHPVQPVQSLQPVQRTEPMQSPQSNPKLEFMPSIQPLPPMTMTMPIQTAFSSPEIAAPLSQSSISPQSTQIPGPPRSPNLDTQSSGPAVSMSTPSDMENRNSTFMPTGDTPNTASTDPTSRGLSQQVSGAQSTDFQTQLSGRLRGAMSAKAFTTAEKSDTVKLVYVGLEQNELTNKELGTPVFAHAAFQRIYASTVNYPGSTYLDFDPETLVIYDGGAPGTLSVSGYAEEYRQQQFSKNPRVMLALEQQVPLPTVSLEFLVRRIRSLQDLQGHDRTDASLKAVLGDSPLLTGTDSLQTQVEALCYTLNRKDPEHFATYTSAGRNVTNHLFGSKEQGVGVKNWLHQIVLGSELLLRLRTETQSVSYSGLVTDQISALLFICDAFMKDVDIQIRTDRPNPDDPGRYTFVAREHARQASALVRFAEVLQWPYIDDVRNYCENAFNDIVSGGPVIFDMYDWLYSLFRPGFHFRFQLMSCLRYATPKIRNLGGAPYYESGLVVGDRSYWSRRTILGKVLGGCRNVSMVCGWIGPCVKPIGIDIRPVYINGQGVTVDGAWIELTARPSTCPVPCNGSQDTNYQYQQPDEDEATFVGHLMNVDNWVPAVGPTVGSFSRYPIRLRTITLANVKGTLRLDATELEKRPSYRASVTFDMGSSREVTYILYNNPFFVYANPCIGEHPLFDRQIAKLAKNTFHISQLREIYPDGNTMIVIDALSEKGEGDEECLARAWCSERGFSAIIRRGDDCCFGCAVTLATQRLGLGFNVLICS